LRKEGKGEGGDVKKKQMVEELWDLKAANQQY
jgi:hypothetical protein